MEHLNRGRATFNRVVDNSKVLLEAAEKPGIGRIVHFCVSNASTESKLPYFRGKGQVGETLRGLRIP